MAMDDSSHLDELFRSALPPDAAVRGEALQAFAADGLIDALDAPLIGQLAAGGSERAVVTLPAGITVQIVGLCDDDCGDVDLTAYGPGDVVLDRDVLEDATPIVRFTVPMGGRVES